MESTDIFPLEVMEEIFSFLGFKTLQSVAVLVCKKWYKIIRQSVRLSGNIEIFQGINYEFNGLESILSPSWPALKVLTLMHGYATNKIWKFMHPILESQEKFKNSKNLDKVVVYNFGHPAIYMENRTFYFKDQDSFKVFSNHFALKMERCQFDWTTEKLIEVAHPIQLTFRKVTENNLASHGTDFEQMLLSVKDLCTVKIDDQVFKFLIHRVPKLESLFLNAVNDQWVARNQLQESLNVHPELEKLCLTEVNSKFIFECTMKFHNLKHLELRFINFPKDLSHIKDTFKCLKSVTIEDCSVDKKVWEMVMKIMPTITRLKYAHNMETEMRMSLVEFLTPLSQLKNLKRLDGHGTLKVTDKEEEIIELATKYINLDCFVQLRYELKMREEDDIRTFMNRKVLIKTKGSEPLLVDRETATKLLNGNN